MASNSLWEFQNYWSTISRVHYSCNHTVESRGTRKLFNCIALTSMYQLYGINYMWLYRICKRHQSMEVVSIICDLIIPINMEAPESKRFLYGCKNSRNCITIFFLHLWQKEFMKRHQSELYPDSNTRQVNMLVLNQERAPYRSCIKTRIQEVMISNYRNKEINEIAVHGKVNDIFFYEIAFHNG